MPIHKSITISYQKNCPRKYSTRVSNISLSLSLLKNESCHSTTDSIPSTERKIWHLLLKASKVEPNERARTFLNQDWVMGRFMGVHFHCRWSTLITGVTLGWTRSWDTVLSVSPPSGGWTAHRLHLSATGHHLHATTHSWQCSSAEVPARAHGLQCGSPCLPSLVLGIIFIP